MASLDLYSQDKKKLSAVNLGDGWSGPIMKGAVYETALWHLACRRAGTASTKHRSEVKGSGRKIYRQKGTGNARHADRQAPIFVGGGIAGGPKPRDWSYVIPKKERRQAIRSVLIHKLRGERLRVIDKLEFAEIKTKAVKKFFEQWEQKSGLLVLDQADAKIIKSVRNLNGYKVCAASSINVADLLKYDAVFMTQAALNKIEDQWLK